MGQHKGCGTYNRGKGKGIDFIRAHVNYAGDDCLIWPYCRDWQGYGNFGYLGKMLRASRFMCEQAHGPAPADKPFALHNCGNGHGGCCNPKHLYWGTPSDNQRDTVKHGTAKRPGGRRQKLTDAQVEEIRALAARGVKQYQIAGRYGVRRESIGQILRGAWRKGKQPHLNQMFDPVARSQMVAKAKALRADGMTYMQIGQQMNLNHQAVRRLANETADRGGV